MKVNYSSLFLKTQDFKKDFYGTSPSVFVGRFNYPNINVGILAPPEIIEDAVVYDSPRIWFNNEFTQKEILDLRLNLINSRFNSHVKSYNKYLDITKEIAMSLKGADLEINLKNKPSKKLTLYNFTAPTGPKAELVKARITSNVKVDSRVEKVVDDSDLKADEAVLYLYKKGFEESFLTKLISTGNLGLKKNRKLVPSKWSITLIDDIIGKKFIDDIKNYQVLEKPRLYYGDYFGNYYFILLFPDVWGYELYEKKHDEFWTDFEFYHGRKTYAEDTAGGYYSNRLAVLEKLDQLKKQAAVFSLRIVTDEYKNSLGVWVVRECSRKSMQNYLEFENNELMIDYIKTLIKNKFSFDISEILKQSKILALIKNQVKLTNFL